MRVGSSLPRVLARPVTVSTRRSAAVESVGAVAGRTGQGAFPGAPTNDGPRSQAGSTGDAGPALDALGAIQRASVGGRTGSGNEAVQARIELLAKRLSTTPGLDALSDDARAVRGEYLAVGSGEVAGITAGQAVPSGPVQTLKAVQSMGSAELLRLGGRLDIHA